jgi:hypothetical protein
MLFAFSQVVSGKLSAASRRKIAPLQKSFDRFHRHMKGVGNGPVTLTLAAQDATFCFYRSVFVTSI